MRFAPGQARAFGFPSTRPPLVLVWPRSCLRHHPRREPPTSSLGRPASNLLATYLMMHRRINLPWKTSSKTSQLSAYCFQNHPPNPRPACVLHQRPTRALGTRLTSDIGLTSGPHHAKLCFHFDERLLGLTHLDPCRQLPGPWFLLRFSFHKPMDPPTTGPSSGLFFVRRRRLPHGPKASEHEPFQGRRRTSLLDPLHMHLHLQSFLPKLSHLPSRSRTSRPLHTRGS